MTRSLITVERVGSPTAAAFEAALNAALSTLLTNTFGAFEITVTDKLPASTRTLKAVVDTDDGGTLITHPYQVKAIEAYDDVSLILDIQTYFAANPTYWFAPVLYRYSDQIPGIPNRSLVFILFNTSAADGAANWNPGYSTAGGGGGPPTGAAGGDLSGTYPNPIVGPITRGYTDSGALAVAATVLQSVALAQYQDIEWEVLLFKGTTMYSTTLRANANDGTTPVWQEDGVTIAPPSGGTFDCTLSCTISGGNLNLVATAASLGWRAYFRSRQFPI